MCGVVCVCAVCVCVCVWVCVWCVGVCVCVWCVFVCGVCVCLVRVCVCVCVLLSATKVTIVATCQCALTLNRGVFCTRCVFQIVHVAVHSFTKNVFCNWHGVLLLQLRNIFLSEIMELRGLSSRNITISEAEQH